MLFANSGAIGQTLGKTMSDTDTCTVKFTVSQWASICVMIEGSPWYKTDTTIFHYHYIDTIFKQISTQLKSKYKR